MFKRSDSDKERLVSLSDNNTNDVFYSNAQDENPNSTNQQPLTPVIIIESDSNQENSGNLSQVISDTNPNTRDASKVRSSISVGDLSQNVDSVCKSGLQAGKSTLSLNPSGTSLDNTASVSRVSSVGDLPFQTGNTGRRSHEQLEKELVTAGEQPTDTFSLQTWEINYREAAIFLDEGRNNDKFMYHPRDMDALPAYLLVHSRWFNAIDFFTSLIIFILGLFEEPCISAFNIPVPVHASIELCSLVLLSIQAVLKIRWVGYRSCLKHNRTVIKSLTLIVMIIEAVVVLIRQQNHFRITRSLRPIFLLDTSVCGGVRRFIRQILQSLPPILDMMGLLLFVMLIYSVLGFYMFGPTPYRPGSPYFKTFIDSFINLFVLLTTANYPDVMMPSYAENPFSAAFFISYLAILLYFLMNLMLAVVYDAFTKIEVAKFKKLFLHKRKACQHAFKLLVTKDNTEGVSFRNFSGLISHFSPGSAIIDRILMFKMMVSKENQQFLTLQDFYKVYDAVEYSWRIQEDRQPYYENCKYPFHVILSAVRKLVKSKAFEFFIYTLIFINGVLLILQTCLLDSPTQRQDIYAFWVSYIFIGAYIIEVILKLIGLGIREYFKSLWNIFDFIVTLSGVTSIVLTEFDIPSFYIIILRPLRLLRLFKLKKRFRDVFGTFVILLPRLNCAIIVLMFMYYFYGIIGVELFHGYELKNCCKDTTVEPYYNTDDNSTGIGYYYLNNFESLPAAGVTLFELTVVNNWFIIMEGFAAVAGYWSRLYFMSFYLFTMVVMTIVVAFILEAFLFRIQYKKTMNKETEIKSLTVEVKINREELIEMEDALKNEGGLRNLLKTDFQGDFLRFTGYMRRTREQLQKLMYRKEMWEWHQEALQEEIKRAEEFHQAILINSSTRDGTNNRILVNGSDSENFSLTRQLIQ
eukprot:TRINITY_DN3900_c0_g1_i4.p1 TRINITY_DN3900_c0_g1~~TRINITY_DN3900_c0_g1_i4.p1  ORF type:complete len:917 (-),score=53.70 TRINITY_DN3900_c0_g1_i4:656-3406(-)